MLRYLNSTLELIEYVNELPCATASDVLSKSLELWQEYVGEKQREEYGAFQIFDRLGFGFWKHDHAKELEISVNDHLRENEHPIRVAVSRININHPLGRVPTATYEVVVLDNAIHEAQDPLWQKKIEDEAIRENK